jgi:protocatechuate 3,4-dioxygenase, beta subunit
MPDTVQPPTRRDMLILSAGAVAAAAAPPGLAVAQTQLSRTPDQILGPFYPFMKSPDPSGDLTHLPGKPGRAEGEILHVMGRVLNLAGEPVKGAKVEIWQANALGRYTHPSDTSNVPVDPNFDGFGVATTDGEGRYRFKTIKPGAYQTGPGNWRPAHIHFDVTARADRLVTQMYFAGDPYNDQDRWLQSARRKDLLVVTPQPPPKELEPESKLAIFDIVLLRG